ncbi:hypothetical protein GJAV_G00039920 [Gymnothorax javanicus]|nr:hypothetical protein GJAV_G00039920 [Gymnothorax javanicus]
MDEKLILAVYECPELYDSTLPIYRNIDRKADAWRKIGALVGLSADEAKRKWKNLRDRYIKEMKVDRTQARAGDAPHKQWRFQQALEFLKPFVRDRQRRAGEQHEGLDYSTTSDKGDNKGQLTLPAKVEGSAPSPTPSGPAARSPNRKRKQAEDGDLLSDEDELFLLSLVPSLKRLSPQKRCQAKIRIQQIMFEEEFM